MALEDDIAFVGQLLDTYAVGAWRMGVVPESAAGLGVPPEMQVGDVNADGWVNWRVLPSTLCAAEVAELEDEFGVRFPQVFRAYLLARLHLFDQVQSQRYDQQIFMTDTPAGNPLHPLRELMKAWQPLIDADFVPFAQWGDGWGPMCFDTRQRWADDEYPVVWLDHEELVPLGAQECRLRTAVAPLAQPLYDSCREFLVDVFGATTR